MSWESIIKINIRCVYIVGVDVFKFAEIEVIFPDKSITFQNLKESDKQMQEEKFN